jgi:hypothetical protein
VGSFFLRFIFYVGAFFSSCIWMVTLIRSMLLTCYLHSYCPTPRCGFFFVLLMFAFVQHDTSAEPSSVDTLILYLFLLSFFVFYTTRIIWESDRTAIRRRIVDYEWIGHKKRKWTGLDGNIVLFLSFLSVCVSFSFVSGVDGVFGV